MYCSKCSLRIERTYKIFCKSCSQLPSKWKKFVLEQLPQSHRNTILLGFHNQAKRCSNFYPGIKSEDINDWLTEPFLSGTKTENKRKLNRDQKNELRRIAKILSGMEPDECAEWHVYRYASDRVISFVAIDIYEEKKSSAIPESQLNNNSDSDDSDPILDDIRFGYLNRNGLSPSIPQYEYMHNSEYLEGYKGLLILQRKKNTEDELKNRRSNPHWIQVTKFLREREYGLHRLIDGGTWEKVVRKEIAKSLNLLPGDITNARRVLYGFIGNLQDIIGSREAQDLIVFLICVSRMSKKDKNSLSVAVAKLKSLSNNPIHRQKGQLFG